MSAAHSVEHDRMERRGPGAREAAEQPRERAASKIRVLIADDQPFLRRGLRVLIREERDMEVCGEVWERDRLPKEIKRTRPDVVIMELYLGDDETIGMIRKIRNPDRKIQVLVLSRHDEMVYAVPSFKAGAMGYVMKHDAPATVIAAIRGVHNGEMRFSWEVSSLLLTRISGPKMQSRDVGTVALSPRELEVVTLIAAGRSSREIATRLKVSIKTVEAHRAHIKQKANVDNSAALIRFSMSVANDSSLVAV